MTCRGPWLAGNVACHVAKHDSDAGEDGKTSGEEVGKQRVLGTSEAEHPMVMGIEPPPSPGTPQQQVVFIEGSPSKGLAFCGFVRLAVLHLDTNGHF